jgi:hypothetical protein
MARTKLASKARKDGPVAKKSLKAPGRRDRRGSDGVRKVRRFRSGVRAKMDYRKLIKSTEPIIHKAYVQDVVKDVLMQNNCGNLQTPPSTIKAIRAITDFEIFQIATEAVNFSRAINDKCAGVHPTILREIAWRKVPAPDRNPLTLQDRQKLMAV